MPFPTTAKANIQFTGECIQNGHGYPRCLDACVRFHWKEIPEYGRQTKPQYPYLKGPSGKRYPSNVAHLQPTSIVVVISVPIRTCPVTHSPIG